MKTRIAFVINKLTVAALFVALIGSAIQVAPVHAASIVVNTSADNYANDGKCTLREAIDAANLNQKSGTVAGECVAGSVSGVDTIGFDPRFAPYVITAGSGGASLQQLPYIISPITISGLGAANTVIQAAATPDTATWRLFQVTPAGALTLDRVTVRNGRCNGSCTVIGNIEPNGGGGIYNSGTLTVANSTVSGNRGSVGGGIFNNGGTMVVTNSIFSANISTFDTNGLDGGGAIRNNSNLTVTNSTFSGNTAFSGGGIYNDANLTVTNSIFSGNSASGDEFSQGGAIYSDSGTGQSLNVTNSTFSGNTAVWAGGGLINFWVANVTGSTFVGNSVSAGNGGGIYNVGLVNLTNSTLSGNTASGNPAPLGTGGGIYNYATDNLFITNSTIAANSATSGAGIFTLGSPLLKNTIVANNTGGDCGGTQPILNGGNNLDSDSSCGWGSTNGSISNANPLLGALTNNGGPTQTMHLEEFSPAIDAGNASVCSAAPVNGVDQRGVTRPLGAGCDIGAYESQHGGGPDGVGVFRPSNGLLYLKHLNTTGFADISINYGVSLDYPVVADWGLNGTTTIGVYRNGFFLLRYSNTPGFADEVIQFGSPGDQPIAGDWNGNGSETIGVYRPSTGQFFLRNSLGPGPAQISFYLGNPGDIAIAGDWNGDGIDTVGVFRPSNGVIFLKNTNETGFADIALNYGIPGDKPVVGDWNGDGIDTIGVYRNGIFYLRNSNTVGFADIVFSLGIPGDIPIAGNWDGHP